MIGIFGTIQNPTKYASTDGQGLFTFLSNIFKLALVIGGIYFVIQVILAGFAYMTANGDTKKTELAWAKIYQSMIGLFIVAAAFVIAAVVGKLTGITILSPTIYGPGQ